VPVLGPPGHSETRSATRVCAASIQASFRDFRHRPWEFPMFSNRCLFVAWSGRRHMFDPRDVCVCGTGGRKIPRAFLPIYNPPPSTTPRLAISSQVLILHLVHGLNSVWVALRGNVYSMSEREITQSRSGIYLVPATARQLHHG